MRLLIPPIWALRPRRHLGDGPAFFIFYRIEVGLDDLIHRGLREPVRRAAQEITARYLDIEVEIIKRP